MNLKNLFLVRLLIVVSLFCQFALLGADCKAKAVVLDDFQKKELQINGCDGCARSMAEEPQDIFSLSARAFSSRLGSCRLSRTLPIHSGASGSLFGHGHSIESFFHLIFVRYHFGWEHYSVRLSAASRKLYYVIALRRILC